MTKISQNLSEAVYALIPFTRNYAGELHASEISRTLGLPQRTIARKLEQLQKLNLLNYRKGGRNKYYFLNPGSSSFSLLEIIECYKELAFSIEYPQIYLLLEELSASKGIILFGSYAKGKAKSSSDIDLVIFARKNQKMTEIIKKYPFEVNAHFVTLHLFKTRIKENWALAKEIMKDHVLIGEKEKIIKIMMSAK